METLLKLTQNNKFVFASVFVVLVAAVSVLSEMILQSRGFSVRRFAEVSIAVVGIQATMFTLVVALLALISGDKDEYLGYNIKEFYFNYSALIKQENVIIVGVLLVPLNVMFLYMNMYNAVYSVFLFSLCLILYSLYHVYKIFCGSKNKFEQDVEVYVFLLDDDDFVDLLPRFLEDWKRRIYVQGVNEFDTYSMAFKRMLLASFENSDSREKLNDLCIDIIKTLLRDNRSSVFGMKILYLTYLNVQEFLKGKNLDDIKNGKPFVVYSEVARDVLNAFRNMDMNVLASNFDLYVFVESALKTCELFDEQHSPTVLRERDCIIYFGGLVGKSLSSLNLQDKKVWYHQLLYWKVISPKDEKHSYLVSRCIFAFLHGQLYYDANNVLRSEYYAVCMNQTGSLSKCFVVSSLLFHCYLWYVEVESDDYMSVNVKKMGKMIAEYGKDYFGPMLIKVFPNDKNFMPQNSDSVSVFDGSLSSRMKESLNPYEKFLDGVPKDVLMDQTVDEFILFCLIYMCRFSFVNPLERFYGKGKIGSLKATYSQKECQERFKRFCSLLLPNSENADALYNKGLTYFK